jgi:hypothetical protein
VRRGGCSLDRYTLQSCYGHFLHAAQRDPHSLLNLPASDIGAVEYRIAYMALDLLMYAIGAMAALAFERLAFPPPLRPGA